jgi:phosphatidate cytidylyltransferase
LSGKSATDKPTGAVSTSNLTMRVITAAVASPLLLALMFLGPAWGWFALVVVAGAVGAFELFGMTHPKDPVARGIGVGLTAGVTAVVYLWGDDPRVLLSTLILLPLIGSLTTLARLGQMNTAALRLMASTGGPLYIGLLTFLALVRTLPNGPGYVLMTLMFAWMADTGAYFAGRAFGRTKLYEAVSPKKTREGFVGGLLGAVLGALLAHFWYLPSIQLEHAIPLSLVCACFGQLGDLVESLLKRSTDIKDSGHILPGHGGLLDRIDGVLFVAPVVYLYALWLGPLSPG